jgi:hypothetical protein
MDTVIDKVKVGQAHIEADGRFDFKRGQIKAAGGTAQLVFRCVGGPFALVQVALFDANNTLRDAVGFKGHGDPLSTTMPNTSEWTFNPAACPGGYVKWTVWPIRNAADLPAYHVTVQVWQNGSMEDAVVSGAVPDTQLMDDPFVDGVMIL